MVMHSVRVLTRQIQLRASASKRDSRSTPCSSSSRAVSYRLHQAFACYRNSITSWTTQALIGLLIPCNFFYILELSNISSLKKIHIYINIYSHQRHVKTKHVEKWVPIELKATSLRSSCLNKQFLWYHITSFYLYNCKKKKRRKRRG